MQRIFEHLFGGARTKKRKSQKIALRGSPKVVLPAFHHAERDDYERLWNAE
jgi:hypothetical protein